MAAVDHVPPSLQWRSSKWATAQIVFCFAGLGLAFIRLGGKKSLTGVMRLHSRPKNISPA
jgi:hypothetical protein